MKYIPNILQYLTLNLYKFYFYEYNDDYILKNLCTKMKILPNLKHLTLNLISNSLGKNLNNMNYLRVIMKKLPNLEFLELYLGSNLFGE